MQKSEVTSFEKSVYNKHLAISRSLKNKPFRVKQRFDDIVDTDKHKHLKRITSLFKKHPEIDLDVFFEAPYRLYPDVQYFGLDYFSTMRAVKAYAMYKQVLFSQDPDTQLDSIKESLRFIAKFCIDNGLYIHQYPFHRTADLFTWMSHYKQNKINIYVMMGFSNVLTAVQTLQQDIQRFFVNNFIERFQELYNKYNKSAVLKPFLTKALNTLSNFVDKELTNTKKQ